MDDSAQRNPRDEQAATACSNFEHWAPRPSVGGFTLFLRPRRAPAVPLNLNISVDYCLIMKGMVAIQ